MPDEVHRRPLVSALALAAALCPAAMAGEASAVTPCDSHEAIVTVLQQKYGEALAAQGLDQSERLLELFISPKGTWTLVVTLPNGLSCLAGAGDNWTVVPAKGPQT